MEDWLRFLRLYWAQLLWGVLIGLGMLGLVVWLVWMDFGF